MSFADAKLPVYPYEFVSQTRGLTSDSEPGLQVSGSVKG